MASAAEWPSGVEGVGALRTCGPFRPTQCTVTVPVRLRLRACRLAFSSALTLEQHRRRSTCQHDKCSERRQQQHRVSLRRHSAMSAAAEQAEAAIKTPGRKRKRPLTASTAAAGASTDTAVSSAQPGHAFIPLRNKRLRKHAALIQTATSGVLLCCARKRESECMTSVLRLLQLYADELYGAWVKGKEGEKADGSTRAEKEEEEDGGEEATVAGGQSAELSAQSAQRTQTRDGDTTGYPARAPPPPADSALSSVPLPSSVAAASLSSPQAAWRAWHSLHATTRSPPPRSSLFSSSPTCTPTLFQRRSLLTSAASCPSTPPRPPPASITYWPASTTSPRTCWQPARPTLRRARR